MEGASLGSFQIVDRLGAGAMGVVYRAQDSRLGRQVAVKVLPEVLANDQQRLGRFQREAKLLASLNHPNIASIYEIDCVDETHFLAMELVEGATLADVLKRGAIPPDKALPIFAQIADALEYAHEQNIIHRDLKPANVMLTDDGAVKILDFGLAKALDEPIARAGETTTRGFDSAVATGEGHVLGTPAYMAPEQASGKKLDKRADIWAFGCCLYEALTGQRPFAGDNATQLMARILERDPDWEALDKSLPARVRILIWRCLQKDPRRRLRDIGEARFELGDSGSASSDEIASIGFTPPSTIHSQKPYLWGAVGVLAGVALAWIALLSVFSNQLPATPESSIVPRDGVVSRSTYHLNEDEADNVHVLHHLGHRVPALAISSDGKGIAFIGSKADVTHLYYLDRSTSFAGKALAGTAGAMMPFFSPDGTKIAFFTRNELKIVSVNGGSPQVLCEARNAAGGCWGDDGTIYFSEEEGIRISCVNDDGRSKKRELLERDSPVIATQLLPDGKGLLAVSLFEEGPGSHNFARIIHFSFNDSGEKLLSPRDYLEYGYAVGYIDPGRMVFMKGDSLWAAALDMEAVKVIPGTQQLMIDGVMAREFAVSSNGHLAYLAGRDNWKSRPVWVDREQHQEKALPLDAWQYGTFDLSPSNDRLAIQQNGRSCQVFVYPIDSDNPLRLMETGASASPVWMRDGNRLAFSWFQDEGCTIALKEINTSKPPKTLLPHVPGGRVEPFSSSPDNELGCIGTSLENKTLDILVVSTESNSEGSEFLATASNEWSPAFSPDGKWIAYTSDKDGQYQVYVRPYPKDDRVWKVSEELGEEPIWSPAGEELFYRSGSRIMSVRYETDGKMFAHENPVVAAETRFVNVAGLSYDVSQDGQRFLILKPAFDDTKITEIRIVQNWIQELNERVPVDTNE